MIIQGAYSYQLLITGFSTSAEIIEPADATMVYNHTHTDLPPPADRAQIEAEFANELLKAGTDEVPMRLWEETVLRVEPSARGKPPELPNLLKRISVDDLLQSWLVVTVQRASAKAKTTSNCLGETYRQW